MKKIENVLIYENWVHFIPTGKSWARGLYQLGNVSAYHLHQRVPLTNIDQNLDVVVYFNLPTHPNEVDALKRFRNQYKNTIIVGIIGDSFNDKWNDLTDLIDVWISMVHSCTSLEKTFEEKGISDLYFIPLAADHQIFFPKISEKFYDISFIGQFGNTGHGYRHEDKYLYPLLDNENLKAYTAGFQYKNYKNNFVNHDTLNDVYNKTKVNLNFHYDHQKTDDRVDFNGRTYEIAMSGNVQLCDHPLAPDIFDNNILCATIDKWEDAFNYILNDDTNLSQMQSKFSRDYFVDKHSWKARMRNFIEILEKNYAS